MTATREQAELVRFMLAEISATAEPHDLASSPMLGKVLRLSDDYAINVTDVRANSCAVHFMQGEPRIVAPESIPLELYLPHFQEALRRRIAFATKRIARLYESIEDYEAMQKACDPLNLGALAKEVWGS